MSDYDPTLNPTHDFPDYDPNLEPGERIKDQATIKPRPSITEEYAKNPIAAEVPKKLLKAIADYGTAIKAYRAAEEIIATLQGQYLGVIQREAELTRLKAEADTEISAWCADYTTYLLPGSTVATLEPPGEINPKLGGGLNIAPGYTAGANWTADYGQIQYSATLSPSGFAWNFTMLNPVQKWIPKWRYGTITAINADRTVNITLDSVISNTKAYLSAVDINAPYAPLTNVAVDYMSCGSAAFSVNDEVIVEFTKTVSGDLEYYDPKVIGFKENPKQCAAFLSSSPDGTYASSYSTAIGWKSTLLAVSAGYQDWTNGDIRLSWTCLNDYRGGRGTCQRYQCTTGFSRSIIMSGFVLTSAPNSDDLVFGVGVDISRGQLRAVIMRPATDSASFVLYERDWKTYYDYHGMQDDAHPDGWVQVSTFLAPHHLTQPFYFSENGQNAIAIRSGESAYINPLDDLDPTTPPPVYMRVDLNQSGAFSSTIYSGSIVLAADWQGNTPVILSADLLEADVEDSYCHLQLNDVNWVSFTYVDFKFFLHLDLRVPYALYVKEQPSSSNALLQLQINSTVTTIATIAKGSVT